jgi:hypothetical protein
MDKSANPKSKNIDIYDDDFEANQNLLGFFRLLLDVDRRVNPHLYKKAKSKEKPNMAAKKGNYA